MRCLCGRQTGRRVYDSETIELHGQQVEQQLGPLLSRVVTRSGHLLLLLIARVRSDRLAGYASIYWFFCGEA